MTELSQEQQDLRKSIKKIAVIWALVLGGLVTLLAYWIMGSQGTLIRIGGAIIGGVIVAISMYKKSFKSGSVAARCAKCDAAFSISKTHNAETSVSVEEKETLEPQEDKSTNVTTWTEEVFDVVGTYTCAKCGDETTKKYQRTSRSDEVTSVRPAEKIRSKKVGKPVDLGTQKTGEASSKK